MCDHGSRAFARTRSHSTLHVAAQSAAPPHNGLSRVACGSQARAAPPCTEAALARAELDALEAAKAGRVSRGEGRRGGAGTPSPPILASVPLAPQTIPIRGPRQQGRDGRRWIDRGAEEGDPWGDIGQEESAPAVAAASHVVLCMALMSFAAYR